MSTSSANISQPPRANHAEVGPLVQQELPCAPRPTTASLTAKVQCCRPHPPQDAYDSDTRLPVHYGIRVTQPETKALQAEPNWAPNREKRKKKHMRTKLFIDNWVGNRDGKGLEYMGVQMYQTVRERIRERKRQMKQAPGTPELRCS